MNAAFALLELRLQRADAIAVLRRLFVFLRRARLGELLSLVHLVSHRDQQRGVVSVIGLGTVVVGDNDQIAVGALVAGIGDRAAVGSADGSAVGAGDVQAGVLAETDED